MMRPLGLPQSTVARTAMAFMTMIVLLAGSSPSRATQTVFDNFASGDGYDTDFALAVGGDSPSVETAVYFTPVGTDFVLEQIDVALSLVMGDNQVDIRLVNDNGGEPGTTVLETWTFVDQMGSANGAPPPLSATSILTPVLEADTPYWVVASSSDTAFVEWSLNSTEDMGPNAQNYNSGPWLTDIGTRGALRVTGTPVPEPASLVLLIGLGGLFVARYTKGSVLQRN